MTDRDREDQAFVDAISEWPDINDGPPTLAGFLLARIAEDEAFVNSASAACLLLGAAAKLPQMWWEDDGSLVIAAQRALAECEAKRGIVELHSGGMPWCGWTQGGSGTHEDMDCEDEPYLCDTLRLLSLPYADHPDYRNEWRP